MTTLSELTSRIRESERVLAPGGETVLWAEYREAMRRTVGVLPTDDHDDPEVPPAEAEWWLAAYRWAERGEALGIQGDATERVLSGLWEPEDSFDAWLARVRDLDDSTLLRLRIHESGLTHAEFAERVLIRERRQLQRWLAGDSALPARLREWLEHPLRHPWP